MATATNTMVEPMSPSASPSGFARWTPSMPTNLLSMLNPFSSPPNDNAADRSAADLLFFRSPKAKDPPSPTRSTSVMFAEPDTRSTSDAGSHEDSPDDSRRPRRDTRPKTSYSICHPPPTTATRTKLHRRPRSLLQLHRLRALSRPLPAFEVIPSANFNVRITRAITKVFKARHGLCTNDVVVLKAEKYSAEEDEREDSAAPQVIGLICKGRKDDERNGSVASGNGGSSKMRIHMASGREWEAYATSNGGYEFFSTDEHGLGMTLRWVPKRAKDGSKMTLKDGSRRFNFSTISPHTRKHPVIATLSKTGLEVYDSYKLPDGGGSIPQPTNNSLADVMEEEGGEPAAAVYGTDDALREVITMTAIWVTFREGWSPCFRYDERDVCGSMASSSSPHKTTYLELGTPPASPLLTPADKRGSIRSMSSSIVRRTSLMGKGPSVVSLNTARRGTQCSSEEVEPSAHLTPSRSNSRTGRTRADSSSTVLVHRAASNRHNSTQPAWRSNELSSMEPPLREASLEASPKQSTRSSLRAPSPQVIVTAAPKDSPHRRAKSDGAAKTLFGRSKPARNRKSVHSSTGIPADDDDSDTSEDSEDSDSDAENEAEVVPSSAMSPPPQTMLSPASTTSKNRLSGLFGSRPAKQTPVKDVSGSFSSTSTTPDKGATMSGGGTAKRAWRKLMCAGSLKGLSAKG